MTEKFFIFITFVVCFVGIGSLVDITRFEINIQGQGLIIGAPSNLDLGTITGGDTVTGNFFDYFWVEDLRGDDTGHYTTIQCDGLYGPNTSTSTVITGVELSGAFVEKIGGKDNDTLVYSVLNSWTDITSPQLYLYRNDNISNDNAINRYGNKPSIKIHIPSGTPVGTYKGKIIYTLYDVGFNY